MWTRSAIIGLCLALDPATMAAQEFPIYRALPDSVEVTRDIAYAIYGERTLLLDLYLPADRPPGLLPVIVVIRGGGWEEGGKDGLGYIAAALAERGFAAASIEYRVPPEARFPAAVEDAKAAVRWLRANATRFGVDPNAIGVIGGSAGGHLALMLGTTAGVTQLEGSGGDPGYSSAVSAVVAMAPAARLEPQWGNAERWIGASYEDDPELWEYAAPITHVSRESAPLLLIHGVLDGIVGFDDHSLDLAARYGDARVAVEVVLIPDMSHAFWASSWEWFAESVERAADFFSRHLVPSN